jgi:hypothetical protein
MDPEGEGWDDEDQEELCLGRHYSEGTLVKTTDYIAHSSEQIEERQKSIIEEAIELLGIGEDDAVTALKHFNWNPEKLNEYWFDNEAKARKTCGLEPFKNFVSRNMSKQDLCYICYGSLRKDE